MAYKSYFANDTAPAQKGGGYTSYFGNTVQQGMTPAQQQARDQQNMYKQQADKAKKVQDEAAQKAKSGSLFDKVKRVAKDFVVNNVVHPVEKSANTVAAGTGAVAGATVAGVQAATGHSAAAKKTIASTNKTTDAILAGGVGGQGGYLTPSQAASSGGGLKSAKENYIKPTLKAASEVGQFTPVGKAAKGATLLKTVAKGATENAVIGGTTTALAGAADGKVNAKDIAKGAAAGAVIGGVLPVVGKGTGVAAGKTASAVKTVSGKDELATQALNRAKMNSLLDKVRHEPEPAPAEPPLNSIPKAVMDEHIATRAADDTLPPQSLDGVLPQQAPQAPARPVLNGDGTSQPIIATPEHKAAVDELIGRAHVEHPVFQQTVGNIAKDLGLKYKEGPVKDPERSLTKVMEDYGGDHTKLKDTVRGTMEITDHSDAGIKQVIDKIKQHYEVVKVKDGYKNHQHGYVDVKVVVKTPGGHTAEILLATPEMLHAKKTGGHTLYKIARDSTKTEGERKAAAQQMHTLYDNAHAEANKRLASSGDLSNSSTSTAKASGSDTSRAPSTTAPTSLVEPVKTTVSRNSPEGSLRTASTTSSGVTKNDRSIPSTVAEKAPEVKDKSKDIIKVPPDEVESVKHDVEDALSSNSLDDNEIVDIKQIGSTAKGTHTSKSDIDFMVVYKGNAREDDMFNALADYAQENGLELNGRKIDFNPVHESNQKGIDSLLEGTYHKSAVNPDSPEALKQEALKYKSADDFIKAQGEPVYHRSPNKFNEFDISRVGNDSNRQRYGWGLYFADTVPHNQYGNHLYEARISKGALIDLQKPVKENVVSKIVDAVKKIDKNPSELNEFSYNGWLFYKTLSRILGGDKDASLFLSKNGIDGLTHNIGKNANDYILFNDASIKTKQQLTHLYNQAHAETKPTAETRPQAKLQTAIEEAHNAGNTKREAELTKQLPDQAMNPNATMTPERRASLMDMMKKQTLKPAEKTTLTPVQTAHMETIGGYTHSTHMETDYAEMLRDQEKTKKGGIIVKNADGTYRKTSEHSRFYRDFYAENKKAPTKADWLEEAKRQLASGKADFGASEDYKKLLEREGRPIPRIQVEKPSVTPAEQGTSKVAKSIQEKALRRGLSEKYGDIAGYDKLTIKEQASKAINVVNGDRSDLEAIISGSKPLPDGLRATALIDAIERHPELGRDPEIIRKLASSPLASESSYSAQELRLARERDPNALVAKVKQVIDARQKAFEKKSGTTVAKAVSDEVHAIRAAKPKVTPETWGSFIDSLKC